MPSLNLPLRAQINVPSPPPAPPGTYIPDEVPPLTVPPTPGPKPEISEPPPPEPTLPVREPGVVNPPQASATWWLH